MHNFEPFLVALLILLLIALPLSPRFIFSLLMLFLNTLFIKTLPNTISLVNKRLSRKMMYDTYKFMRFLHPLLMFVCPPPSAKEQKPTQRFIRFHLHRISNKLLVIAIIIAFVLHDGIPLAGIGLHPPTNWWPTQLTVIAVLLFFVLLLRRHLSILKRMPLQNLQSGRVKFPRSKPERLVWVVDCIITGVWEEMLFRGLLPWYIAYRITFLGITIPYHWAVIISLILFSICHFFQQWRTVTLVGFVGAICMILYVLTGNLFTPILGHILFNARLAFHNPALELQKRQEKQIPADEQKTTPSPASRKEATQPLPRDPERVGDPARYN